MKQTFSLALIGALVAVCTWTVAAQATKSYRVRLSAVPMDLSMAATVAGSGSATATLAGNKLTVNGTYDGLKSSATVIKLHKGQRGVRGPAVMDVQTLSGTSGKIAATIDLTPQLVQDLQNTRLYLQLYSEKAPDGNLWGWLMPQENKK